MNAVTASIAMPMITLVNSGVYVHAFVANGYSKVVLEITRLLKGVDIDEAEIKRKDPKCRPC